MGNLAYAPSRIHRKTVIFLGRPLNLSEMAKDMNVSHSLLSRIFSGHLKGSVDSITRISQQLDLTVEETLKGLKQRQGRIQ